MKNATTCAKKLTALLKKLPAGSAPPLPATDDPIGVLIQSFLMWEATTPAATAAYDALLDHVVDFNDLRVTMPHEIVHCIGGDYPRALDRAQRLRAVLRDIYQREHAVSLERLQAAKKRDVRRFIESLDGMTPYVAARVLLLCFDTHAVPVSDQLRTLLVDAGAADVSVELVELGAWLSRQIKAEQGVAAYLSLQAWVDEQATRQRRTTRKKTKTSKKSPARKKTTARKTAPRKTKTSTRTTKRTTRR